MYFNLNIYDIIINMKRDTFINTCIFISFIYCINYSVINFLNKNAYDLELEEINSIKKEKLDHKHDKEYENLKPTENEPNDIETTDNIIDTTDMVDTINNIETTDNIVDTTDNTVDTTDNTVDTVNIDTLINKVENDIKTELDKKTKLLLLQENLNSIKKELENLKNDLYNKK